jgi:ribonuclease HII
MEMQCGIEEAGRGPVIGPMVMCGLMTDKEGIKKLAQSGAKDSKLITPQVREMLYETILKIVKNHVIIVIPTKEIDENLESPHSNLNILEAEKSAEIISALKY